MPCNRRLKSCRTLTRPILPLISVRVFSYLNVPQFSRTPKPASTPGFPCARRRLSGGEWVIGRLCRRAAAVDVRSHDGAVDRARHRRPLHLQWVHCDGGDEGPPRLQGGAVVPGRRSVYSWRWCVCCVCCVCCGCLVEVVNNGKGGWHFGPVTSLSLSSVGLQTTARLRSPSS